MQLFDITRHIDELFGYAMVLTRDPASASDLVQKTYVRAVPAIQRWRDRRSVKAGLFKILRNLWLNKARELRSHPTLVDRDAVWNHHLASDPNGDPHVPYPAGDNVVRVRTAIDQLPLELREIIVLREYERLSYLEIAEVLGCPTDTVVSRLARARQRLHALLTSLAIHPPVMV